MAFDSAASLLFEIGANSDDAEANIQRFRQLLGTDLDALAGQFEEWSTEVFGSLDTVKGGLIGVTAAMGALAVAGAAFTVEAGHKFEEFAISIDNASRKTGIGVEQMSALKFSADELSIPFEQLVQGITRFESSVYKANEGGEAQVKIFARLGISSKEVADGENDIWPLLEKVADRLHDMNDGTEKAAILRELFARGGPAFTRLLDLGSEGIKRLGDEAKDLGITLSGPAAEAARDYEAAMKRMHAQVEAIDIEIGEKAIPLLEKWSALKAAFVKSLADDVSAGFGGLLKMGARGGFLADVEANYGKILAEIDKAVAERSKGPDGGPMDHLLPPPAKLKAAAEDFHSITDRLEEMRLKMAGLQGPEAQLAEEMAQWAVKARESETALNKASAAHRLLPGVYGREKEALVDLRFVLEEYDVAMHRAFSEKDLAELQTYVDALTGAKQAVRDKIAALGGNSSYEQQRARIEAEIEAERQKYAAEGKLDAEMEDLLVRQKAAGMARIEAERKQSYDREMAAFQDHLGKMLEADMTAGQKLAAQHQSEVDKLRAEATKAAGQGTPEQAMAIGGQYMNAQIALTTQYQNKLQELVNSQGWRGVFGDNFAQLIKGNEDLAKQWAQSTNQSVLMVKVAVESMGEMGREAFGKFAEGMGAGIAHAIEYSKSIGQAMRESTAATLESLASRALAEAVYSLAWGFLDLAEGDIAGADAAFQAAALFGAVGVASAVAGKAVGGHQAGAAGGGSRGGAGGGGGGGVAGVGGSGGASGVGGAGVTHVTVNVQGHVIGQSGIEEFCSMVNDAVQNRDVRLIASQTRQSGNTTF